MATALSRAYRILAVNDRGFFIGEDHPKAKLTDEQVESIRALRESGTIYKSLAKQFQISHHEIGRICRYERRAQTIAKFRKVMI